MFAPFDFQDAGVALAAQLAAEVLHAESDPTQLDRVKLLDFVIELALRIFEAADDQPQSVYRFFVQTGVTVVHVKSLVLYARLR